MVEPLRSVDVGSGPAVVLLPSLGRGADDYADLAGRIVASGRRAIALDPPEALFPDADLFDIGRTAIDAVDELGVDDFDLVGHAFGNRWARAVTARIPERVRSLTLLAAGGLVDPEPDVHEALITLFDLDLPTEERLGLIDKVFFADGNDPAVWIDGWLPIAAAIEGAAVAVTDLDDWWTATPDRVLIVQGLQDVCAPPENGRLLVSQLTDLGRDARLIELDGAGHALLPEVPGPVAEAVLGFLDEPPRP